MTLDDLTVSCAHLDRTTLLDDWRWLIGDQRLPVLVTLAGDAFVQDSTSGEVIFLDTVEGSAVQVASSGREFEELLTDKDFVVQHFAVELVAPLLRADTRPAHGQLFSFKKPPVLGGAFDTENLEATDIEVHFSLLGQIWRQVKNLPEGTPISEVRID
jgi:hypothetical protein